MDSSKRAGYSIASSGLFASAKALFSAKLYKLGIFGTLKLAGISAASGAILPLTAGIGAATFGYHYWTYNILMENCSALMQDM